MAKDHITRLLADTSGFDSRVGESIRFVTNLHKSIEGLNNGMIGLSSQERSLLINMGKVQPAAKSAEVAIAQLEYIMNGLKASYEKMSIHTKISSDGKLVSRALIDVTHRVNELKAAMESMPKKSYVPPVTNFNPVSSAAGAAGGAGGVMVDGAGGGKNLFGKIMGGNLAARAVMDTLRFLKKTTEDAVKAQMEFEYSNATLSAVLGKTKDEVSDLTIQAQQLGATTLYSAKQISELQVQLARLGFNKNEIKDSTDAIAKLALATGVDLSRAAELTGSTMRAFGYRTSEAARVASVLGVVTTKSALDMEKLRTSMAYASSVARQAGFEIEDVAAMLGKMVDNGQQATTAGVNMRNIMLDLSNKSSKLSRAIKEVTGKDQVKNFDEFVEALKQMRDAGINLDDVANVVQKRVTPGFLNMIANTDGIAQLRDELKGCTGELDAMADKMENTLKGSITKLGNAWNALMISFANSKGPLKQKTEDLANLISEWAQARIAANANTPNVKPYESIDNKAAANDMYLDMRARGISNADIMKQAQSQQESYKAQADIYAGLKQKYDDFFYRSNWGSDAAWKLANEVGEATRQNINKIFKELMDSNTRQDLGKWLENQRLGYNDYAIQQEMLYQNAKAGKADNGDIRGGVGLELGDKLKNTGNALTDEEKAAQRVEDALNDYEVAIRKAALEKEVGYINEEQYTKKVLQAEERLFGVYSDVAATIGDPEYKNNVENEAQRIRELAESAEELRRAREEAAEAEREEARKLREQRGLNMRILRGLQGYAKQAGIDYETARLSGKKEDIDAMPLGGTIDWSGAVDTLNQYLAKKNFQISVDLETGSIEKIKDQLAEALGEFKSKLGAVKTLVNFPNELKQAFEGLAETIEDGASAWDTMFAVFNTGFTILESVAGVMEAINTLQKVGNGLTLASAAAKGTETTATLTQSAANTTEASTAGAAAAAEGGKAVSWLPIVGPILAVAAIAAIAAAIASANRDTEYHANGGMVGMDGLKPRGTDVVPAMLTPGEVVLSHAMTNNLAGELQGAGRQMVMVQVSGRVSGKDILLAGNNYNRARGGSRGAYTKIK